MIPEEYALNHDIAVVMIWSATCFVAGVAYAAYRAVGWVERIRTWAETVHIEEKEDVS